jgi:hypothetical protein
MWRLLAAITVADIVIATTGDGDVVIEEGR